MDMTVNETALDAKAVDVFVAEQADVTPASESDPVPKRFRKARRAACAGLAVVLAFVVLLVAEILLTDPRRGATTPRDLELFLNRVRPCRALAARRTRPDVETRSQTTNCHTAARDRSDSIDRDAPPQLTLDQSALPSLDWNCLMPIPTDARPLRAG